MGSLLSITAIQSMSTFAKCFDSSTAKMETDLDSLESSRIRRLVYSFKCLAVVSSKFCIWLDLPRMCITVEFLLLNSEVSKRN